MATINCDECGAIGESDSVLFPDPDIMDKHMDEKHNGKEFGYSIWKD